MDSGAADGRAVPAPLADTVAERLAVVEHDLLAATGGASLCAVSRSGDRVDAVKYLEGRMVALMELRRELQRVEPAERTDAAALAAVTDSWRTELAQVRERDAGPNWIAYRSGGVDELGEVAELARDR